MTSHIYNRIHTLLVCRSSIMLLTLIARSLITSVAQKPCRWEHGIFAIRECSFLKISSQRNSLLLFAKHLAVCIQTRKYRIGQNTRLVTIFRETGCVWGRKTSGFGQSTGMKPFSKSFLTTRTEEELVMLMSGKVTNTAVAKTAL
jgi:hypothetical protein